MCSSLDDGADYCNRKHAGYWESGCQALTECGAVNELAALLNRDGVAQFEKIRPYKDDPPDCVGRNSDDSLVGFEATELVDEETVGRRQRGQDATSRWDPKRVLDAVAERIQEKDAKDYTGGPYNKLILVIYTDELSIAHRDDVLRHLAQERFSPTEQLDDVYLLCSYDPGEGSCRYVELDLFGKRSQ